MKRGLLVAVVAVCLWIWGAAGAGELSLFNVELRDATQASLHRAALTSDARLISSSGERRVYDVSKIGLPGAQTLETLFDGDRFVVAAYTFKRDSKADHELRRLLVAKYGEAHIVLNDGKTYELKLSERYVEWVSCRWTVDAPMELVYTNLARSSKPMSVEMETRLTYVNRPLFEELQRRTSDSLKQSEREGAARLKGTF